jgi:hypothetical protein
MDAVVFVLNGKQRNYFRCGTPFVVSARGHLYEIAPSRVTWQEVSFICGPLSYDVVIC